MDFGSHTLCLKVADLEKARAFYEAIGAHVNIAEKMHVNVDSGTTNISLMTFLEENCLNFRGGDIQAIYDDLKSKGFELEGEVQTYEGEPGGGGACWLTRDPDGNVVFFDTSESDSRRHRVERLMARLELELRDLELDSEHLAALKNDLLAKVPVA